MRRLDKMSKPLSKRAARPQEQYGLTVRVIRILVFQHGPHADQPESYVPETTENAPSD